MIPPETSTQSLPASLIKIFSTNTSEKSKSKASDDALFISKFKKLPLTFIRFNPSSQWDPVTLTIRSCTFVLRKVKQPVRRFYHFLIDKSETVSSTIKDQPFIISSEVTSNF